MDEYEKWIPVIIWLIVTSIIFFSSCSSAPTVEYIEVPKYIEIGKPIYIEKEIVVTEKCNHDCPRTEIVVKEATCNEMGQVKLVCGYCKEFIYYEYSTDCLEHNYSKIVYNTETELLEKTCSVCEDVTTCKPQPLTCTVTTTQQLNVTTNSLYYSLSIVTV